jgi:hypothetical protein
VPFLWRLHALHHSDPDVDVTTSVRHHPIEYLIASATYWQVVLALDIPTAIVLSHGLTVLAIRSARGRRFQRLWSRYQSCAGARCEYRRPNRKRSVKSACR